MSPDLDAARQRLVGAFTERAQAAAARVTLVSGAQEAAALIITATDMPTTTGRYTATGVLASTCPNLFEALVSGGLDLRVAEAVSELAHSHSEMASMLAGDIGIVHAAAGVAETGSYLSAESTLPARLLGMLADSVYVILPAETIVAGLDEMGDLLAGLSARGMRYLSLVTGPSRTADIERVLTIGVQGPKALHILVLDKSEISNHIPEEH
jgi:L-lactate dehydrogenase complex protein LldG